MIGEISRNLDYIASAYAGVKDMGTRYAPARLKTPYWLVAESKSNSTIGNLLPIDYTIGYR